MISIRRQAQNDYMREYLNKRETYLQRIVMREGVSDIRTCQICQSDGSWRCLDCFVRPILCMGCCRDMHKTHPFHRVESWTGTHFEDSWLLHTGFVLNLGHNGDPCPSSIATVAGAEGSSMPREATVLETSTPCQAGSGEEGRDPECVTSLSATSFPGPGTYNGANLTKSSARNGDGITIPAADRADTEAAGESAVWEADTELPLYDEDPECNEMGERLEDVLDSLESFRTTLSAAVEVPEAEPFDNFALNQAGANKMSVCGVKVLVIVHCNAVHRIPVRWCRCPGHSSYDIQALDAGLFPASYKRLKTLFTFHVLDDFLAENQECKTSAYHYFEKLRRFTSSSFPHTVPVRASRHCKAFVLTVLQDRYRELIRLTRQWRDLKRLKWNGFAHSPRTPLPGELAVRCPACPQPGINLPTDWKDQENQWAFPYFTHALIVMSVFRWLYTRMLAVDGNFTAVHDRQKRPEEDVFLTDGTSFMTKREPYQEHLKVALETYDVGLRNCMMYVLTWL
jgi:CxC2 like cysteine cluster associated with KDZ transposases